MVRLKGMHHVGVPVRSMEESLRWYRDLFGLEPEFVEPVEGPELSQTVQLEDARMRFAFLRLGNCIIELLEYESPVGNDFALRNCDVGAMHICLEVEDIEAVYEELSGRGVPFSIGPQRQPAPIEGDSCCYFRGPDGLQFELWQRAA
jgi:catechol 2,3-dioxygenase-like lactoylglutathione lyase family enzyme